MAVKVLHRHVYENESVRRRLRREMAATRRLRHPSIVRIEDLIERDEVVALVMELVEGATVRERVQSQGPLSWEEARPLLAELLAGLDEAHRAGIWHRDLNAEHVLLTEDGGVKIVGFGMARVDELVALTMHTRVLGSLDAMAPERVLGMDYDGRADLYSVGAIAHELLLGHPPADGTMAEAFRVATEGGGGDEAAMAGLDPVAQTFLRRALSADRSTRFATAEQMGRALSGDYDEALWTSWENREVARCPECETLVIDGLDSCVECGHEFRRFVQGPGAGSWSVEVVTPSMAFTPDVWFEKNTEPPYLLSTHVSALMATLSEYDDARPFADGRWEYREAPYVLVTDLEATEAHRIHGVLKEAGVPSRSVETLPSGWRVAMRPVGFLLALTVAAVPALIIFALSIGYAPGWIALGTLLFLGSVAYTARATIPELAAKNELTQNLGGHRLMIPTEGLQGYLSEDEEALVPEDTGRILAQLDRGLHQEIHELLVLSVGLGARELSAAILSAALDLNDRRGRLRELDTAQLMGELEGVERRLETEKDPEEGARLVDRRRELLDLLDDEERYREEVTALQSRLLSVRATLLELRGGAGEEGAVEEEAARLQGLTALLEARELPDVDAEVEAMAEEVYS